MCVLMLHSYYICVAILLHMHERTLTKVDSDIQEVYYRHTLELAQWSHYYWHTLELAQWRHGITTSISGTDNEHSHDIRILRPAMDGGPRESR